MLSNQDIFMERIRSSSRSSVGRVLDSGWREPGFETLRRLIYETPDWDGPVGMGRAMPFHGYYTMDSKILLMTQNCPIGWQGRNKPCLA